MKNQYFGDLRDVFKYDLVLEILFHTNLTNFTFIPMLTPNDLTEDGMRINYDKVKNKFRSTLKNFLIRCVNENRRNIKELKKFFNKFDSIHLVKLELSMKIYEEDQYFTNLNRRDYFNNINDYFLKESVILVDPDNGLEVKSMGKGEKYIKYEELKMLFERMDNLSVLIIFQFIPRVNRQNYISSINQKIKNILSDCYINYITDNIVVFIILTKTNCKNETISKKMEQYAIRNKLNFFNEYN